ncbi:hypothetical protein ACF07Y_08895, partial [Streptomyces sp. NPDC016566]|uniref:hypothetical protein n=1 Tax=Streptomyces sp. NPDC016566 TaxID=3364967 RepID=UPI0036F9E7CC
MPRGRSLGAPSLFPKWSGQSVPHRRSRYGSGAADHEGLHAGGIGGGSRPRCGRAAAGRLALVHGASGGESTGLVSAAEGLARGADGNRRRSQRSGHDGGGTQGTLRALGALRTLHTDALDTLGTNIALDTLEALRTLDTDVTLDTLEALRTLHTDVTLDTLGTNITLDTLDTDVTLDTLEAV